MEKCLEFLRGIGSLLDIMPSDDYCDYTEDHLHDDKSMFAKDGENIRGDFEKCLKAIKVKK